MLRKLIISAAVTAPLLSAPANAENHDILVFGNGLVFPYRVYVQDGDTLTFINDGESELTMLDDEQNPLTAQFLPDESVVVQVTQGMKTSFYSSFVTYDSTGIPIGMGELKTEVLFERAPSLPPLN